MLWAPGVKLIGKLDKEDVFETVITTKDHKIITKHALNLNMKWKIEGKYIQGSFRLEIV